MNIYIDKNRMQAGFCAFVIFLYALYGAYILSLYILVDDKDGLRSPEFFLFVIVLFLLSLSNFSKILIIKTIRKSENSMLLVFLMYMLLKIIMENPETRSYYLGGIISEVATNFTAGFIIFSIPKLRMPGFGKVLVNAESSTGTGWFA